MEAILTESNVQKHIHFAVSGDDLADSITGIRAVLNETKLSLKQKALLLEYLSKSYEQHEAEQKQDSRLTMEDLRKAYGGLSDPPKPNPWTSAGTGVSAYPPDCPNPSGYTHAVDPASFRDLEKAFGKLT